MKPSEMREITAEEIKHKEQDLRKELFNLRFQQATGEIENPMRIRAIKREIARMLTIITEKNRK
jgi:large subunit ribosomal protein L29